MSTCPDGVFIIELTKDKTTEGPSVVLYQLSILSDDQKGKGNFLCHPPKLPYWCINIFSGLKKVLKKYIQLVVCLLQKQEHKLPTLLELLDFWQDFLPQKVTMAKMTSSSAGKRHSMKFNSLSWECFLECQAVTDSGSVLAHCDKYRALAPTTHSSAHLLVLELAAPDGSKAQTASSTRTVSSLGQNCATSDKGARKPLISPATYLICLYMFFHRM